MNEDEQIRVAKRAQGLRDGWVKLQNITLPFGRHVVPQFVYLGDRAWRPSVLVLTMVDGQDGTCRHAGLTFDVSWNEPVTVYVSAEHHRRVKDCIDRSAIYECWIKNGERLPMERSIRHHEFALQLFHHTAPDTVQKILGSKLLKASKWNYLGSKELTDRHFVYLTDVPSILSAVNLAALAMSDGGITLAMLYDQASWQPEMLSVPVRERGNLSGRIEAWIDPELIEMPPLLYHDSSVAGEGVTRYWELCHPHIFRIPMSPTTGITLRPDCRVDAGCVPGFLKSDRVVAGCAFEKGSLRVIFDEEPLAHLPINTGIGSPNPCPLARFME